MDRLKELLAQPFKLSKNLAKLYKVYIEKFEFTGFSGVEPHLAERINTSIKKIEKTNSTPKVDNVSQIEPKSTPLNAFQSMFEYYHLVEWQYHQLRVGYDVFQNRKLDLTHEGSYTSSGEAMNRKFITDMMDMFDDLEIVFSKLSSIVEKDDLIDTLVDLVATRISNSDVETVTKIYKKYYTTDEGQLVVRLYSGILQNIIQKGSKDIIKKSMKIIKELKSDILRAADPESGTHNRKVNTVQRMIQWHDLVPQGPSAELSKIATILGISSSKKILRSSISAPFGNWANLLSNEQEQIGFIVITKITSRPMENKIWMLTDKAWIEKEKLFEPLQYGVSSKSIQRGNTLTDLPVAADSKTPPDDIKIIKSTKFDSVGPSGAKYYYVLDTLDGTLFRLLHPYYINPRRKQPPMYKIPADWLEGLDDIKKFPSRDLENYNAALEGSVLDKLIKPKKLERPEIKWDIIRQKIHIRSISEFREIITQRLKKQKATEPLIASLMTHPEVYQSIIHNTVDLIRLDRLRGADKIPPEKLDYYGSEIMMSYLKDLDKLERNLAKKMNSIYQRLHQDKIKRFLKGDIKNKAITVFGEVLKMALEDYINNRSSMYATIKHKTDILNVTLFKL